MNAMPDEWVPPPWASWSVLFGIAAVDAMLIFDVIGLTAAFWIVGPIAGVSIIVKTLKSR
jgi:hypothetical protein